MSDQDHSIARMMAATAMSQALEVVLRRNYFLGNLDNNNALGVFECRQTPLSPLPPFMLEISQVGSADSLSILNLAKVLRAAHAPGQYELVFLLLSDGMSCRVLFGIRGTGSGSGAGEALNALGRVLSASYPGTMFGTEATVLRKLPLDDLLFASALTGVPSTQQMHAHGSEMNTVDTLIRGMQGLPFAYVISATPIATPLIDSIIFNCREMQGQAESLKSFSLTSTDQENFTRGWQRTEGTSSSESYSSTESRRDAGAGMMLAGLGLAAGSLFFPPAAALLGLATTPQLIDMAGFAGMGLLSSFTPSTSDSISRMEGKTRQFGVSASQTVGVSTAVTANCVNKHVEAMAGMLGGWLSRLQIGKTSGFWNTRAYVMTRSSEDLHLANLLVKSALEGERNDIEPIRAHNLDWCWKDACASLSRMLVPNVIVARPQFHPLGDLYSQQSTPLNTAELCSLINLPQRSTPGITVVDAVPDTGQEAKRVTPSSIRTGVQIHSGAETKLTYPLEINDLARHTLVCGMTRKGKTNTCKHILEEVMRIKGSDFPFLVIEPAKAEYVDWALAINKKKPGSVNVFMPGRPKRAGHHLKELQINPFEVIWPKADEEPRVLEHIECLTTIINASLPMQESLPVLMEEAVFACYEVPMIGNNTDAKAPIFQWLPSAEKSELPPQGTAFPTFETLARLAPEVINKKGYHKEAHMGLTAAMTTRISSFTRGWKKTCLCTTNPDGSKWDELFNKPTVINLSALSSDDDKAFFMAVLLMFLYEYRQLHCGDTSDDTGLKHVLLIEEAHRVLCNGQYRGPMAIDPRGKVADMFSNMISEIGAYGQGIVIADQVPGRLAADAIKNTNLKIVHRLVAADDRDMMSICLDLKPSHARLLGALETGQALIRSDTDREPVWVKITKARD